MILLLDLDNTTADLTKKWLDVYNSTHNDNLLAEQITTWNLSAHANKCSPELLNKIIEAPNFFAELNVFPDAVEVTKRLQSKHQLYFVTATPLDSKTAAYDKNQWVEKYFPHIGKNRVIHTHEKQLVKGDLLFDDGPTNLENFYGFTVAMDFAYNRHIKADARVNNWLDFEIYVNSLGSVNK